MIPNRKALVSIGLLVIAGTVQADPTVINTCPTVISSPGRYLLGQDLICPVGGNLGAIVIASSDVTLALEGHTITAGVNPSLPVAINVQSGVLENVHILGPGLITNFGIGIALFFANNSEVSGVTVQGSGAFGIGAFGCNFLTITGNTVGHGLFGISVSDVNSSTISDNDASGNQTGVSIGNQNTGSTDITVGHNVLNGNTSDGLLIAPNTNDLPLTASVQKNITNGNGQHGIVVSAINVEVSNNTSLANGMFDLFDSVPGCAETRWSGNTFFTANQSCIH